MIFSFSVKRSLSLLKSHIKINKFISTKGNFLVKSNFAWQYSQKRFKYSENNGVKGLRNRKHQFEAETKELTTAENDQQTLNLEDK